MNSLKKTYFTPWPIERSLININPKLTCVQPIISPIDMTPQMLKPA